MPIPDTPVMDNLIAKLGDLIGAIEAHPLMVPPNVHKTPYFVWDFIQRSRHMLRELPKVREEKGEEAAEEQWSDALQRCIFSKILINDTTGKLAIMTGGDPRNPVDFGQNVKDKAEVAVQAIPQNL